MDFFPSSMDRTHDGPLLPKNRDFYETRSELKFYPQNRVLILRTSSRVAVVENGVRSNLKTHVFSIKALKRRNL